mgnify:CR=1 FL=1
MIKNIEKDVSTLSKDFNNLKGKLSTRKNIRKMRTQKEIKAKLSELIKESVIIEKELEDYMTECKENGLIPEYDIRKNYESQIYVLTLRISMLQWVLNE